MITDVELDTNVYFFCYRMHWNYQHPHLMRC